MRLSCQPIHQTLLDQVTDQGLEAGLREGAGNIDPVVLNKLLNRAGILTPQNDSEQQQVINEETLCLRSRRFILA